MKFGSHTGHQSTFALHSKITGEKKQTFVKKLRRPFPFEKTAEWGGGLAQKDRPAPQKTDRPGPPICYSTTLQFTEFIFGLQKR